MTETARPRQVAEAALNGIEAGNEGVLVDELTQEFERSLCTEQPVY